MRNLLANAAAWLDQKQKQFASQNVQYSRGSASATVAARFGRSVFEVAKSDGTFHQTDSRDFIITVADLILDGSAATPVAGDRISYETGGKTIVCEVMPFGSEPPWRYADEYRVSYRIHSKVVEDAETAADDDHDASLPAELPMELGV
jgi:hypothetical protein